jgi:hypothetical protein
MSEFMRTVSDTLENIAYFFHQHDMLLISRVFLEISMVLWAAPVRVQTKSKKPGVVYVERTIEITR